MLILSILLSACSSTTLIRTEKGDFLSRNHIETEHSKIRYEISFTEINENKQDILRLQIRALRPSLERWKNIYSQKLVYGTKSLFSDEVSEKTVVEGEIEEIERIEDVEEMELRADTVRLILDGKKLKTPFKNQSADFKFNAIADRKNYSARFEKAVLKFNDFERDVSYELKQFLEIQLIAQEKEMEAAKAQEVESKNLRYREKCLKGNKTACDKWVIEEAYSADLVALLFGAHGGESWRLMGGFKKDTLYTGQAFEMLQKVDGGYMFSGHRDYFRSGGPIGMAFLRTNIEIPSRFMICFWAVYTGMYSYIGINGFTQQVPSFRLYNGPTPTDNPHCAKGRRFVDPS